ncbi:hypothetical protein [Rhizobacter sp. OV335]|uniref:hypothetical protein n=1 Tax=Rhizobacter sp. OV335 TaxID=1500264 RepID=UPI001160FFD2|nr:hypothetical protein [Rhizobacter sp. OV335]
MRAKLLTRVIKHRDLNVLPKVNGLTTRKSPDSNLNKPGTPANRKMSLSRENSREALPKPTSPASLSPKAKEISAEDIYNAVVNEDCVDLSFEKLGRAISEQEIANLGTAIEFLTATAKINLYTEIYIAGQNLGDANIDRLVRMLPIPQLNALDLSNNNLTANFRKTLRFIYEQSKGNLRYLYLEHNDLGTGKSSDVKLLADYLIDLQKNSTSLIIDATDNNFPQDIVQKLDKQRTFDADGDLVAYIITRDESSNQIQSPKEIHTEMIPGTAEPLIDKISAIWRDALTECLGQPVFAEQNRIFSSGSIPGDERKRKALIDLLCSSAENPGGDEELTLEFATENGKVRLTRTMASTPETAATFIQAAFILSD